jgi:2-polyprenyl-6-hydroxyphenyl methylase/3-demethylubiquinone-9 3-methyltransferase
MYLYDTINRTWLSKVMMITLVQDWLRIAPPDLHDWKQFIKPNDLHEMLMRHGLEPRDTIGVLPDMNPITSLKRLFAFWKVKRGKMTYAELGRDMVFRPSRFTFMNYMGYAIKSLHTT